jgi:hypothetical protein
MKMPHLNPPHLRLPHIAWPHRQDIAAVALFALIAAAIAALVALGIANPAYFASDGSTYPQMIP